MSESILVPVSMPFLANIKVNVDLDLVEDTSPKFGGKVPKQELL